MTCEYCWGQDFPGCKNCDSEYVSNEDKNKKISDLTVAEALELFIKAIRECKRQDEKNSEIEYKKLTKHKKESNPLF